MKSEQCNFEFCSICPVEKCDIRKNEPKFKFRCNGNCNLCNRALHYSSVGKGTPFEGQFSVCKVYQFQIYLGFQFYARVGEQNNSSIIENEIYQYEKCKSCAFENDVESLKKIIKLQEEKGWLQKIDGGELMDSLKATVTMLQDFKKEKDCAVAIGIIDLISYEGITETKLLDILKQLYILPKCFFCSERSLRYLLDFFEAKKIIYKDENKWYKS